MPFIYTKINAIDKHRHLYVIKMRSFLWIYFENHQLKMKIQLKRNKSCTILWAKSQTYLDVFIGKSKALHFYWTISFTCSVIHSMNESIYIEWKSIEFYQAVFCARAIVGTFIKIS